MHNLQKPSKNLQMHLRIYRTIKVIAMGKMMVLFKIMPQEPGLEEKISLQIKEKIGSLGEVKEIKEEPIAFGIKAIKTLIILDSKTEGLVDKIEKTLKQIKEASKVTIEGMNLL